MAPSRVQLTPAAAFAITNVGGFVMFGHSNGTSSGMRGVLDYGFMINTSTRDAFGGSVFASLDQDGFAIGPAIRYRRWLTATASLEVAVGKPVAGDEAAGAVFGLVKWSPNHWLSVAARPEIRRSSFIRTGWRQRSDRISRMR